MKTFVVHMKSLSPFSPSKYIGEKKEANELHDDFEKRIWRERIHADESGMAFIPAMAFKNGLAECAKFVGEKVGGKGRQTYSRIFESGIMVVDNLPLGVKKAEMQGEWLMLNSDGKKGGGSRVPRCMPFVPSWEGKLEFVCLHDAITLDVFKRHMDSFGTFIGVGRFRPSRGGYYGRFQVVSVKEK
jgi:hypothetical protein